MNKSTCGAIFVALVLLLVPQAFAEGSLKGSIRNGTTGKPAGNALVALLQLQGGMETVGTTMSDAQGRFQFENSAIGRQPMLVRVTYKGVNFHQPVPPGHDTAEVEVFEPSSDPKTIAIPSRFVVFQPNGANLLVGEEFIIQNTTKPAVAFFKNDGSFVFHIPEHARLQQVAAWGPSGMPVTQGTMDRGPNRYAIAFAFRPGESGVRVSYELPYPSSEASLRMISPYAVERVVIAAPPSVNVKSPAFQPVGNEQGMNLYAHDAVAANSPFDVVVSGTAPPPSEAASGARAGAEAQAQGQNIQVLPSRLDSLKWPLVSGFAALFVLGAFFLWRRPAWAPQNGQPAKSVATAASAQALDGQTKSKAAAQAAAEIQNEVGASLEALKDSLFRLELRRQAGTISEEEYAREHARTEQILREWVKG